MNIARSIGRHRIGGWEFLPATGELRRRTDLRRLEPRAARTLELLCEAKGEVVSQEELIAAVWQGRALSENSVAVVIGQLRRALEDDAREPRLIESIPKRGYRLRATQPEAQT
jgi:DNA-binding winged helix-turn-helix (wHTH) protein